MSSPEQDLPIHDLTSSFGAMFIGSSFSFAIWGIICVQTFLYYASYPTDTRFMKVLIFVLWIMDTARLTLQFTALWSPLIKNWGSVTVVNSNLPIMLHSDWIGAIVTSTVQFVFLWRIYRLGAYHRWKWAVIVFVILAGLYQFSVTVSFDVLGLHSNHLGIVNTPPMKRLQISDRTCTAVIDVVICVSLVKLLLQNGIPVYNETRQLLYRGIVVTINTGLWTAILSIVDLVLMGAKPETWYFCVIELPIQSLYVVTLLSNLNARSYVRGKLTEWDEYLTTIPQDPSNQKGIVFANFHSTDCGADLRSIEAMNGNSVVTTEIKFAQPGSVEYHA